MSTKSYCFYSKNNDSKKTESLIADFFRSKGYLMLDVSNMKGYQEKDIDFLAYINGERDSQVKLEVKSDTYNSPNYFAEVISNTTKNTLGCWLNTQADYLLYYFEYNKELHIIPVKEAQEYVLNNYDNLKSTFTSTKTKNGKILYYTEGKLINKKKLQKVLDITVLNLNGI